MCIDTFGDAVTRVSGAASVSVRRMSTESKHNMQCDFFILYFFDESYLKMHVLGVCKNRHIFSKLVDSW